MDNGRFEIAWPGEPWRPLPWPDDLQPPKSPVILRHPPTYDEWLDSLPWVIRPPVIPRDRSPDEGRSRVQFVGYRDTVTYDYERPIRLRVPQFVLLPEDE